MTFPYCTEDEKEEIRSMYRSGEYSLRQLGELKNLSKGTIINIIKDYPYTKDKAQYYAKLQNESAERLEQEIQKVKELAQDAHERGNMAAYGLRTRQWLTLVDMIPDKEKIYERLRDERSACEQKAWEGFGNSDYGEFGYYADTWNVLTWIIGDNMKNPWGSISKDSNAKGKSRSVKYSRETSKGQDIDFPNTFANVFFELSNESWVLIRPLINPSDKGKHADDRRTMNGIIYALQNCRSFRSIPSKYGSHVNLYEHFSQWYKADVFTDLLAFVSLCPELEPVKSALLQIEKHRMVYGAMVPRLCDIRKGIEGEKV